MSRSSSYSLDDDKFGHTSSGWALHELAENHQFASGVIVSLFALAMAFGIIGLIAALPHTNLVTTPDAVKTQGVRQQKEGRLDTPQEFVRAVAQDMEDVMTGVHPQWMEHDGHPHRTEAGEGGPGHALPHRG